MGVGQFPPRRAAHGVKVFVAGATGFLGRHLLNHLAGQHDVVALSRRKPPASLRDRADSDHHGLGPARRCVSTSGAGRRCRPSRPVGTTFGRSTSRGRPRCVCSQRRGHVRFARVCPQGAGRRGSSTRQPAAYTARAQSSLTEEAPLGREKFLTEPPSWQPNVWYRATRDRVKPSCCAPFISTDRGRAAC